MIIVNTGTTNNIIYYSRYNQIDYFEILDHDNRILTSGNTTLIGSRGHINHSGVTYPFSAGTTYTYKAYFYSQPENKYYLSNHSMLKSIKDRLTVYNQIVKENNTFKTYKK